MNASTTKSICLLAVVGVWASLPHPARCQSKTARQQIQTALQKADASFQHKDINGCLGMLTGDFQGTDIRGDHFNKSQTRQSLIKEFSPRPLIIRSAKNKSQVLDITLFGHRANVMYHQNLVITITGKITHQQHVLTLDTSRRSIWVQENGVWREQRETQLTSRITQDGVLKSVKGNK